MKKLILTCIFWSLLLNAHSQVYAKVSAFLKYQNKDSLLVKHRSREAMIKMNINTGEVKLKVPLQSFGETDTALQNALGKTPLKMELFFAVDGDPFSLHSSNKHESVFDAPGMLHINNHYHHVKVKFSISKKSAQTSSENLAYLISISYSFLPKHYALDKLVELSSQPIKISLYKQAYSFEHNTF